jgi:4-amino-4-deoxy-L-arabinose transferase-like glycosyltransferase
LAPHRRRSAALLTLLVLAALLRLALALAGWPESDSDEATIGLAALHIARDGAHPAYFYGQDYMGTLEAWLGAATFHVLGVSTFALRLGVIALTTAAFAAVYLLAVTLYDRRVALGTLALLVPGSEPVLYNQVKAVGGHAETLLFGALCLLLATRLARSAGEPVASPWRRRAGFAGWGLSAGLGLWSHLLVAPFVLASAAPLLACCRRELRGRALPWLLGGLLLGGAPMWAHDLAAAPGHRSSVAAALGVRAAGGVPGADPAPWSRRLGATFLVSLPRWSGATVACRVLPGSSGSRPPEGSGALPCRAVSGMTSGCLLTLWTASLWQALRLPGRPDRQRARRAGRLALLGAAALTLALYATSPAPAVAPLTSIRYLFGLLIATPALLAPLLPDGGGAAPPLTPP